MALKGFTAIASLTRACEWRRVSILVFFFSAVTKRTMKIEYQAQKVSLESRILKKKVRGKVNTLPLPRTVQKARHAALVLTSKSPITTAVLKEKPCG